MKCTWREYTFQWIQGGLGLISEDVHGHVHSKNSYELHYIIGGKGLLRTDSGEYPLNDGVFFVTGPDIYHEQLTDKDDPLTEVHCYLQGSGKKTKDILVSAFLEKTFYIGKHKKYKPYFMRIAEETGQRMLGYESMVESSLVCILTEHARKLLGRYNITQLTTKPDVNDKRFLQIEVELIDNCKNITLAALSEKIGLCERQTQRLIRKYYGMSFSEIKKMIMDKQEREKE